ncbi:hypothetical protein Tco_1489222, partial [Tanacetum coccineum]
ACYFAHTVEEFKVCIKKQCDEDDVACQEVIVGNGKLAMEIPCEGTVNEDLRIQYAKCNDMSSERRALIDKFLDDKGWKDYKVKSTL